MNNINQKLLDSLIQDSSFVNWVKNKNRNDIQYWNSFISNNEDNIETIDLAKSIVLGITFSPQLPDKLKVDAELESVLNLISKKPKTQNWFSYGIAASVIFALLFFVNKSYFTNTNIVHKTTYGKMTNVVLPDGTEVLLNGNSELSYNQDEPRIVSLEGEAYFKVKPILTTQAKFWVNTGDVQVSVFGTKFHVNAQKDRTDVGLDEGSIELQINNGRKQQMKPGELITFVKKENQITYKNVSKESSYSIWREGTYVFHNIALEKVMQNIEETYGLKADYDNENSRSILISGGIPNKNLTICLAAIEKATNTKITLTDNKLFIVALKEVQ